MRQRQVNVSWPFENHPWAARGVLNTPPPEPLFHLERLHPSPRLSRLIEYYWAVHWDLLPGQVHTQETLPHPNVHVVFEETGAKVYGVVSGKFSRTLEGKSQVFGVRFAPGLFHGLWGKSVASLTDRSIPAQHLFGDAAQDLERTLKSASTEVARASIADEFFLARLPPVDPKATLAHALVLHAREVRDVLRAKQLAEAFNLNPRTMQRLFSEYVGTSAKWVIRRYRLQEAITLIRSGTEIDFPQLAVSLGYYDQAHLINDFKSILGYTPLHFHKSVDPALQ